jgi:hypothetical protein
VSWCPCLPPDEVANYGHEAAYGPCSEIQIWPVPYRHTMRLRRPPRKCPRRVASQEAPNDGFADPPGRLKLALLWQITHAAVF